MLLTALLIFLFLNVILYAGLHRRNDNNDISSYNKISVVIAAKNEARNIPALIEALKKQSYNKDFYEVIFVDDDSTDDTYRVIEESITNQENFHLIRAGYKSLDAKKGALTAGIKKTNYDYILITDADCKPDPDWIDSFNKKFQSDYDILFGKAPITKTDNFVNKISRYENLRNSILMFSAASLKIPYCAYGRSFGFQKESFNKLNGYENTQDRLSGDDDLLIREAVKMGMKIGTVDSFVWSSSKLNIKDYILQRSRHTSTSQTYLIKHQLLLGLWHLLSLILLFSPIIFWQANLIIFPLLKLLIDAFLILRTEKRFSYSFNIPEIIYSQVIYDLLIIINFFASFIKKDQWK